jgi:hypothetical protein
MEGNNRYCVPCFLAHLLQIVLVKPNAIPSQNFIPLSQFRLDCRIFLVLPFDVRHLHQVPHVHVAKLVFGTKLKLSTKLVYL